MDRATGKVHEPAKNKQTKKQQQQKTKTKTKREREQYSPIQTEQAS